MLTFKPETPHIQQILSVRKQTDALNKTYSFSFFPSLLWYEKQHAEVPSKCILVHSDFLSSYTDYKEQKQPNLPLSS